MVGLQADNQGTVIIGIEFGPVHGYHDLGAFTDHIGNPIVKEAPAVELGVSEQAVHLFHRMFALETIGQGENIPDGVDGQRTGFDNPEGCIGQGKNTLGMHVLSKYLVDVVED